ncbi:pilus assembly protein [Marinomonas rhizomae]|uniref:TadE-like protein n=1 Tax=Marinomonas rhizomae TaxID=491948 RepID=A0A366JA11_9GAMM|nr:pilus assembly protein [Marinomonas rhizomae]RBP83851.1 hypothetical protein DFP80_105171 [Marinomonas rhizomae]RNF73443.1 pilus assembly protein [Marinomonas rhizomae]
MRRRFLANESGATVIEFALSLPIMFGILLVSTDLYNINRMRGDMEQASHNLASILANQQEWNADSFDYLIEHIIDNSVGEEYELIVSKVNIDRSMDWSPIRRGEISDVCAEKSSGKYYSDQMPEEDPDSNTASFLVIQLCRYNDDLIINSGLLGSKKMESTSINRLLYHSVVLDKRLSGEVGVEYEE